jgi:hypothetical protein
LAAVTLPRYYGHGAAHDAYGVIEPWYRGLNGQCDWRVRIAAETLKRYPWTTTNEAVAAYPHYLFTSLWHISTNGVITPKNPGDWMNGDIGQRATSVLNGFVDYYRYSGDAAAIAHLTWMADFLIDHCCTPLDHPWPGLFVSVPVKGKAYGDANADGMIQLDLVGSVGQALLRAYQVTANPRWFEAAKHWGDLLAEHCNLDPDADPWPRYANPEAAPWKDNKQTGGVTMILGFLDELVRLGYTGADHRLEAARDAGQRYLREKLLPAWTVNDTWGRYFWDWANPVQNCLTTPDAARYLLDHPAQFANWRIDARNILMLFLNRSSVNPDSRGDVYSGAWAFPEANNCCGRSLWYAPLCLAPAFAQYAVQAPDPLARELAYRMLVLQTYDAHETGVSEDGIDGGIIVNGDWLNIAHPLPLRFVLGAIAWLPEELGACRENHLVRSSAVVNSVVYGQGRIEYSTFDAPVETVDVLRLAFKPNAITADGKALKRRRDLAANGYTVKRLPNGDAIVCVRRDGAKNVVVTGDDPQQVLTVAQLVFEGEWKELAGERFVEAADAQGSSARSPLTPALSPREREKHPPLADKAKRSGSGSGGGISPGGGAVSPLPGGEGQGEGQPTLETESAGAAFTARFADNQVRLIGRADPFGGLADVYLDGEKQLVHIDCWNPQPRCQQVLYYRNGLASGPHTVRVVARGARNPYAQGRRVYVDAVQFSAAGGMSSFPSGAGPSEAQRMVFGYTARTDYRDSLGQRWRPATEFVTRIGAGKDSVADCWWTTAATNAITGTPDPGLYRYGVHAPDFWVNATVGPGRYHARLKFAATRGLDTRQHCFNIRINEQLAVTNLDVAATAGGPNRAVDLVFDNLAPRHGIIEIRLTGARAMEGERFVRGEAFLQALEIGPGSGGRGARPVSAPTPKFTGNLLLNPGFEETSGGAAGARGHRAESAGWRFEFAGPSQSYAWQERDYEQHPDWGLPEFHTGRGALRTHTDGDGHTRICQEVEVEPSTAYIASVWVRAADLRGKGFGQHPEDSAGLVLCELDAAGNVRRNHDKLEVKMAGVYAELKKQFVTSAGTAQVRFILETVLKCHYAEGHVTYDDCSLRSVATP